MRIETEMRKMTVFGESRGCEGMNSFFSLTIERRAGGNLLSVNFENIPAP